MPDFNSFLRLTAIGLVVLFLSGVLVAASMFSAILDRGAGGVSAFIVASTLFGLILEPLFRRHPRRREVKRIYDHVAALVVDEVGEERAPEGEHLELVAKSVYEYVIWTFAGTETYMQRVNQQVRYAYFYFALHRLYLWFGGAALAVWVVKAFVRPGAPLADLLPGPIEPADVDMELLLGTDEMGLALAAILVLIAGLWFPARFFYRTADNTILVELDSRHLVLLANEDTIRELARAVVASPSAQALFRARAAEVASVRKRSRYALYWLSDR